MKSDTPSKILKATSVMFLLSMTSLAAQNTAWNHGSDPANNNWSDPDNWSNGVPDPTIQTRFLNGSLPDEGIVVNVDTTAPAKDINFTTSGNRSVTIGGGTLYLQGFTSGDSDTSTIKWNTSFDSVAPITINSNIDYSHASDNTSVTFQINLGAPITFNGNIGVSGTYTGNSRTMQILSNNTVTINGSNAATFLSFGGTGELIAGHSAALGAGAVQKTSSSTLSLRSDVTVIGTNSYSWLQNIVSANVRINETTPGSTVDRTLTMNSRITGSGTLQFVEHVNSTGNLILELKYQGGNAQNLNLITNDTAIIRFSQTGNTTYSGVISGTGQVEKTGGTGTTTLSAANTYTGDTIISNGTVLLAATGKLNFLIEGNGENNQITGTAGGNVTLNGTFTFDLSGASTTPGASWNIVDVTSLGSVNYGETFAVENFTKNGNIWTFGDYEFSQVSGLLTTAIPEPSAVFLTGIGMLLFVNRRTKIRSVM